MPSDLLANVKELLARELELCKTLRAMVSRELEAIVLNRDMDELLRVLESKDAVISQLQLLTEAWSDVLTSAGLKGDGNLDGVGADILELFPEEEELQNMLAESRTLAEGIMKAEKEAQAALEQHAAGLRGEMTSMLHGRKAAASYAKMGGFNY